MATSFNSRAGTFSRAAARSANMLPRARHLGIQMSRHAAVAVLCFAVMQIWLVSAAIEAGAPRGISVGAMIALLALALPYARIVERRWQRLGQHALPSPALMDRFRGDVRQLWVLTAVVPAMWTGGAWFFL
jgi:hypothetical protein